MSLAIEHTRLGRIPALIVRSGGRSGALPTVLWLHGFGADKEVHVPELCRFAAAGLLAVGIDAVGHGQRRFAGLPSQFSRSSPASVEGFDLCVSQTVAELPDLIAKAEAIYHLAAAVGVDLVVKSPIHVLATNQHETEVLLAIAAKQRVPTLVASTSEVYGKSEKIPFSEGDDSVLGPTTTRRWAYACART